MATGERRDDGAAARSVGPPSGPIDGPGVGGDRPVLALARGTLAGLLPVVPALRALRRAYPGRTLLLAADGEVAALLRSARVVDGVVPVGGPDDPPPGARLPGPGGPAHRPHTAVNLRDAGPAGHRLLLAGRPDEVLWFACLPDPAGPDPAWGLDSGPHWGDAEPDARRWCRLVASTGVRADPDDVRLPRVRGEDVQADPGAVVLLPGTGPAGGWPDAARALAAAGHRVVVAGPPDRAGTVREPAGTLEEVAAAAGPAPSAVVVPSLRGLLGLVRAAALVVAGDDGTVHLARAAGTPVVRFGAGVDATVDGTGRAARIPGVARAGGARDVVEAVCRALAASRVVDLRSPAEVRE